MWKRRKIVGTYLGKMHEREKLEREDVATSGKEDIRRRRKESYG